MEAKLINSFDISAAGGGKGLLGDIDGDGRMEVVFVQADSGIDDRFVPHPVSPRTVLRESCCGRGATARESLETSARIFRRRFMISIMTGGWKSCV
jgi:hypothetical protein